VIHQGGLELAPVLSLMVTEDGPRCDSLLGENKFIASENTPKNRRKSEIDFEYFIKASSQGSAHASILHQRKKMWGEK